MFILISNCRIPLRAALPVYYARDGIQEIFASGAIRVNPVPARVRSEPALRGCLTLSFVSMIAYALSRREFAKFGMTVDEVYLAMRGLKLNIFGKTDGVISEPDACMEKIIRGFGFKAPEGCHWE
jgi:hypothetical protein